MQLCLQKFLIKVRFSGNKNQNSWNYSACFLTCSPCFRRLLELWEESPAVPPDTQAIFFICASPLWSHSGSAAPAETIVFLQPDLALHVLTGAEAPSKRGVLLFGAPVLRNPDLPHSTWAHPWLLSSAQGKGHNLHFRALIKLVADKTPFWQGTTAQQIGSSTQLSGAGKTLLGWWIVTHRFSVGWGARNRKKIKIQLTSVYYLSLFNVHSRVPLEIFQMILYLSWLTNVSFDLA